MPLEKTTLTRETIETLLQKRYHISVLDVQPLSLGTANCFRVAAPEQTYFLKEFQTGFSEADLVRETQLVNFLADRSFPVPRILPAADGTAYFAHDGRLVYLQDYVDGHTDKQGCLPPHLLMESAALLGRLHSILANYSLPADMDKGWFDCYHANRSAAQYDHLLSLASKAETPYREQIQADLLYKKELAYRITDYAKYYRGITYCATHGDFSGLQCICGKEHIRAVVDFSSARVLPVVWEIMRAYVQSSQICKNGDQFSMEEFRAYVSQYMEYASLTKADLQALPYVYLYQLARSKYGYKEYLLAKAENREQLLQFAFWRTRVCRMLETRAAEIASIE